VILSNKLAHCKNIKPFFVHKVMAFQNRLPCYVCNALRAPAQMTRIGRDNDAHKREIAIF